MDERQLAMIFYADAQRIAEEHEADPVAIGQALVRAGIQLFVDFGGPTQTDDWLTNEAANFHRGLFGAN